jgi:hypothetical protein
MERAGGVSDDGPSQKAGSHAHGSYCALYSESFTLRGPIRSPNAADHIGTATRVDPKRPPGDPHVALIPAVPGKRQFALDQQCRPTLFS